jgi:hypothetical protein
VVRVADSVVDVVTGEIAVVADVVADAVDGRTRRRSGTFFK